VGGAAAHAFALTTRNPTTNPPGNSLNSPFIANISFFASKVTKTPRDPAAARAARLTSNSNVTS
jgi:hypothetical protein